MAGQIFMVDTPETRQRMLQMGITPPGLLPKPITDMTPEEIAQREEIKKEHVPPYVNLLSPEEAAIIRRGPGQSATQNAWIWKYAVEIDPKFQKMSLAEQNRKRLDYYQNHIVPNVQNIEELNKLRPAFMAASFAASIPKAAGRRIETMGPDYGPIEEATPEERAKTPIQMRMAGIYSRPPKPPEAPEQPLNPLGAMIGAQIPDLALLAATSMIAPGAGSLGSLTAQTAGKRFALGVAERALHSGVTFGAAEGVKVLAGQEGLEEGLLNTAAATLAFGPKSKILGSLLGAGFDAALSRSQYNKYTGNPLLDQGISSFISTMAMRTAFEGRADFQKLRGRIYQDRFEKTLQSIDRKYSTVNLLAEKSKTGGEGAVAEQQILGFAHNLRGTTPGGALDNITGAREVDGVARPPADRITAELPQEEVALMKQGVEDFKKTIGRKLDGSLKDVVPRLEAIDNLQQAEKIRISADRLRKAVQEGKESELIDAIHQFDVDIADGMKSIERFYPEYFTGGNAVLRVAEEHRVNLAIKSHYSPQTRAALRAIWDNPPTINFERWQSLSDEVGPQGYSPRDEYLAQLMSGPEKAFNADTLLAAGETKSSLPLFIRTLRDQGYLEETPSIVDGLGIPKVSVAGKRVSRETKAGAVPEDKATQEHIREREFLLEQIRTSGMPSSTKETLRQLVMQGILPTPPTGKLQVYPRPPIATGGRISDSAAKAILTEMANKAGGPALTYAQAQMTPEQIASYPPEMQRLLISTNAGLNPQNFLPELKPGESRTDIRGVYRSHFLQRYNQLRGEGYGIQDAYNQIAQELAALRELPPATEENWQKTIATAEEKVASRKALPEEYGVDYETLENGKAAMVGLGGNPYQGMTKGESEADPLAVAKELQRTGLNGRYNRETNAIEVETKPGSGNFTPVSFQELKNLPGPGNYTADGRLIVETRNGKYDIVKNQDGTLSVVEKKDVRKAKGSQKPMSLQDFTTVLYSNTGWKLEVMHEDGSARIFDPSTREVRELTAEEVQKAATIPRPIEDLTPGFSDPPVASSYDPTKERRTPTDPITPLPDDVEYLGAAGPGAHVGQGGYSPEALSRGKTTEFVLYNTKTGQSRPLIGPEAVDVGPGPNEVKYQIHKQTGHAFAVEAGKGAIVPSEVPAEIRPTRTGPARPAITRTERELRQEYLKAVPLPPHPTSEQLQTWQEGLAAYISSARQKGTITLGMGGGPPEFKKGTARTASDILKKMNELTPEQLAELKRITAETLKPPVEESPEVRKAKAEVLAEAERKIAAGEQVTQEEFRAYIENLTAQKTRGKDTIKVDERLFEQDLYKQIAAKSVAEGKEPPSDAVEDILAAREFLRNKLEAAPKKPWEFTANMGAGPVPPPITEAAQKAGRFIKTVVSKRKEIGPAANWSSTKAVMSFLQEGKVGQKYKLPFYEVWRTSEEYASAVRDWYRDINPKVAKVVHHLRGKDQAAILEYLKAENWDQRIAVRNKYNMSRAEIDMVPAVRELLQQAFGTEWQNFLNVHYPSFINSRIRNRGSELGEERAASDIRPDEAAFSESRETPTMKTWREKGGLVGKPADLMEMIPNALSARARMSMNNAFEGIKEIAKRIRDLPEDLDLHEGYQHAKSEYMRTRNFEHLKYMRDIENSVMPKEMKDELLGKLFNYQARVTWGVSSDHKAARTFIETVYNSAGVNVDTALFDKLLPNYLLLTYTSVMPGRAGMIIRNLMQPTMTVLPYVGPEAFGRGMTEYMRHATGQKPRPELDALFKELGLKELQGVALEHLLAGELDTTTLPKRSASFTRRRYNALMKPFAWSERTNRRIAATVGYDTMMRYGDAYKAGEISDKALMRRTGLIYMEKAAQREVLDAVKSEPLERAATKFARNMAEDTQWMYHAGNTPEIFNSKVGRFFGQFGTWPLSYIRFAKRGIMSGDMVANMQFAIRMVALNVGLQKAGQEVFGIEPGSWLWAGPMAYAGGPGASLFAAYYYATRPGYRHELGMQDLAAGLTNLIPFYMMGRDIKRALEAESFSESMKRLTGFRSYEK